MEDDLRTWIFKILLPSLVAISVKLAIQARRGTVSYFNALTSIVIGIGTAYICSDLVIQTVDDKYLTVAIAVLTIAGEKLGFYVVYKLNVELILNSVLDSLRQKR